MNYRNCWRKAPSPGTLGLIVSGPRLPGWRSCGSSRNPPHWQGTPDKLLKKSALEGNPARAALHSSGLARVWVYRVNLPGK